MRKLLKYLSKYKKECVLGPLFKLLEASFELLIPLVVASIIDKGIGNSDTSHIFKMGSVMVLLGIIGLVCAITAQFFAAKAAVGFGTGLRKDLFKHITSLSHSEIDEMGTASLITRMTNDINQLQSGVNMVLRLFLRSPFIVFGAMVMAFTINVKAAITFVVVIPLLSVVVFGIMVITMPLYKKVQKNLEKVLLATRENLAGVRIVRAFGKEKSEIASFNEYGNELLNSQKFVAKISALLNPVTYVLINGATIILIWVGAIQVDSGIITQGEVVALVNYMSQILVELIKLANLIVLITKALACADRINVVFEKQSDIVSGNGNIAVNTDCSIEFKNVNFIYKNAKEESLTNIDFSVKKGETLGIIGGTGSGKSSLVNLIPRFYDASQGQVLINGIDVKEYKLDDLRKTIGVVPQRAVLFKGSIRENMQWGNKDATDEEIYNALEIAQAKDFVEEKTGKLDFAIAQGGKNLSGGQRQRLTIARALVKNPQILIMDDSSSALDFATDARLRKSIANLDENMTVVIVSQRASTIMNADKILVLDDGCLVGVGKHSELINKCEVYKEICLSQLSKEEAGHNE